MLDSAPATSYDGSRRRFNLLLLISANLLPLAGVVLVLGKTGLDIALHLKEHRQAPTD